jgi:hypothetical protein
MKRVFEIDELTPVEEYNGILLKEMIYIYPTLVLWRIWAEQKLGKLKS